MRDQPRITVEKLASEVVNEREQLGLIVDLSESGLRLERRFFGRREGRIVQLEFELPEVDEIVWAKGEVCFDQLRPSPTGPIRSTGIRLVSAASRHLRMLRDWVMAAAEARAREESAAALRQPLARLISRVTVGDASCPASSTVGASERHVASLAECRSLRGCHREAAGRRSGLARASRSARGASRDASDERRGAARAARSERAKR